MHYIANKKKIKKKKMNNIEIRNIQTEIRSVDVESRKVTGLAIPVNSRSELLYGEFYETILPEAINEDVILNNDIKLYMNHDASQGTYARSKNGEGSLKLSITERGLEFETELADTVFAKQLLEGIRRGDYDAISFAFVPNEQDWEENEDGTYNRSIRSISFIDEISILSCAPAYEATEVNIRSLEDYKEKRKVEEDEKKAKILAKLNVSEKESEMMTYGCI